MERYRLVLLGAGWIAAQLLAVFFIGVVKKNREKSLELAASMEKCTRQRNEELKKIAEYMITQSKAERSRMSKMLCNIVAYQQTGLLYHSEALMNFLVYNDAPQANDATKLVQIAEQNIEQVKNITKKLSPQKTVEPGIEQNLHRMSRFFTETVGTSFSMMLSNRCGDIPDAVALHLCRIAHEAVTNALRHGKATHICLALELDDTTCTLIVENNGNPIPQSPTEGIGTRLIQQRADIIHATTRLGTSSNGKTRFECTAPLRGQTASEFRLPIWPPAC